MSWPELTRNTLRVAAALLLLGGVWGCGDTRPSTAPTTVGPLDATRLVTRAIDGDTIVVEEVGTVRLIGVDTPETVEPGTPVQYFGMEASAFTRQMAVGKHVRLEFDVERTDRYVRSPTSTCLTACC